MCAKQFSSLESLEQRRLFAVVAQFSAGQGILTVFGDNVDNTITVSRNAAGNLLVNGGAVSIKGGTSTVANTTQIQVFGQGGNDNVGLSEVNGALPKAFLYGGAGNDTLTGGSGADMIFGQAGNDSLLGKGGADLLFGGADNDALTGGDANDQVFGESGNDRMIWNPGDDTDLNEGGDGFDTVEVNGGNGSEVFATTANGTRVRFDRLDPAPFTLDIGTSESLVLNANGGNDSFSNVGNLAALILITADGGTGNDTLLGSNGADLLLGGDNDDFVDGQQGNDSAFLGAGNDTFQWDPGDGSDVVEGQAGSDRMVFNASNAGEIVDISANGGRVRLTRNIGSIVMDVDDVETFDLNMLGGIDSLNLNDLTGTDLTQLNANLAAVGGAGDALADTIVVNGTNGNDIIDVFGSGTSASVVGLHTLVNIAGSEGANDALVIKALGGDDGVTASTLPAGVIKLTVDLGAGNDTGSGSPGADVFIGGEGEDLVNSRQGNDVVFLGAGNDIFQWNPGDGSDTVEGQADSDLMLFFGSNVSENINVFANGGRVLFTRDVANIAMDLDDVERIEFRALGGSDNIAVGDLTGTDMVRVDLDLRGPNGGGDETVDNVTVNGTQGADVFGAAGDAGGVTVFGLKAQVNLFFQEQANDRLTLNGLGGDDVIDAASLEADGVQLAVNAGLGNDVVLGSEGDDLINGGDGNDALFGGAGADTFVWNPGDDNDVLEGQAGRDKMLFNGANVSENINISANGPRVLFTRDIAGVVMDLNDVESIDFNALGGADNITVNDLTGIDLTEVNLNLAAFGGAGDAQQDRVTVKATNGDDVAVAVGGSGGGVAVFGLFSQVNITGSEGALDRLNLEMLDGDDVVDASGLGAGVILLAADGGKGNDVLIGSEGNDILNGNDGDDVLIGGPGQDVLEAAPGNDVVIQ
ncbi:MAG TPA: calcium-binding protein [Tepidisphaeraceae bacterium]|jgi:Ca2+-binding RTX toxin-like protein